MDPLLFCSLQFSIEMVPDEIERIIRQVVCEIACTEMCTVDPGCRVRDIVANRVPN
jgi:hypothetical protein